MKEPAENDLRVWNIINMPAEPDHYTVSSVAEAARLIGEMATAQLKQDWIETNAFGLEVFEDGEWCEWQDEDGYGVGDVDLEGAF